eukprot:8902690-Pyramimonas_sp.AAC.1
MRGEGIVRTSSCLRGPSLGNPTARSGRRRGPPSRGEPPGPWHGARCRRRRLPRTRAARTRGLASRHPWPP